MNLDAEQARVQTNLDEYGREADPDCARAMAEAENVLRELSLDALFRPQSSPGPRTNLRRLSLAASAVAAGLLAGRLWSDNPMPASLAPLRCPAWRTRWPGARIVRPVACSPQRSALTRPSAQSELRIICSSAVMIRDSQVNFP